MATVTGAAIPGTAATGTGTATPGTTAMGTGTAIPGTMAMGTGTAIPCTMAMRLVMFATSMALTLFVVLPYCHSPRWPVSAYYTHSPRRLFQCPYAYISY